jgi:uncharacterized membrane protein
MEVVMRNEEHTMAISAQHAMSQWPKKASRSIRNLSSHADRESINRSLALFSLGLGLTQLLAPRALGRAIGVGDDRATVMRLCGVREIASGVGMLSGRAPAAFAMARVLGDAMDLALLGASLTSPRANRNRIAAAATAVAGVAALDVYASKLDLQESRIQARQDRPVKLSMIVNSSPEHLYEFWRKLDNLPRFMKHIASIQVVDERVSRWTAVGPGGLRMQWESEIVEDRPNELISWRTRPGSEVSHRGSVRFEAAPGGRGTVVRVEMHYSPSGNGRGNGMNGGIRARAAKMLGSAPEVAVREDLRRLKQLIEAGEVPTTRGQPSGARSVVGRTFTRAIHKELQ